MTTAHDQLYAIARALKASGLTAEAQKLIYIPETSVPLPDETVAAQLLRLCDALEDNDDVQDVHANFDLSEELLTKLSA